MDLFDDKTLEISKLERDIPKYAKAYYEGAAIISDEAFDKLVDRLRELKPNSIILHTPGWGYKQTGSKLNHKYQIVRSLDKCRTWDEIPERFKNKEIALSPKLDGLTGVFYYEKGKLIKAITRGNGQEGKDITDKARIIVGNEIVDKNFTGGVRGELEIPNENWNIIKDKYPEAKNARNLCAGWINSKEYNIDEIKLIHFITYKITGQENVVVNTYLTKFDVIDWLASNFKDVIPKVSVAQLYRDEFDNSFMEKLFNQFKNQLDYELDGVVISDMNVKYDNSNYSYIYDECAFKFAAEEKETTIKNIAWELSRTQRYVPVLEIEPVELSGATVQNVTGNNAKYLIENGLGVGAIISVCRSGEVIPKHISTLEPADIDLPTHCPDCGSELEWVGVDLKCVNKKCPHIKESDLEQWCTTIGETDGLQWTTIKPYLYSFNIFSIDDLYNEKGELLLSYLQNNRPSITDMKIIEFLHKLLTDEVDVEKALIALNIPRLGDKTAKLLANQKVLIVNLVINAVNIENGYTDCPLYVEDKLLEVVKEATTKSILENYPKIKNLKYLFNNLGAGDTRIVFKEVTSDIEQKYVAVTGSLTSMKRKDFEEYISKYGYELSGNLKKCKYLITNTPDSGSSKNKDAQKYGIPIITEQDFLDSLR